MAIKAIQEALKRGFRVTTNTTLFDDAEPEQVRKFFDAMMELGVEGMMISPGYSYAKAPDQKNFLKRNRTTELFSRILHRPRKGWRFNQSPLFLDFLMGKVDYQCTPWGNPTYNPRGWKAPCYLITDGHHPTFKGFMEKTDWEKYGRGRDPRCENCMVHVGYEPAAVLGANRKFTDT